MTPIENVLRKLKKRRKETQRKLDRARSAGMKILEIEYRATCNALDDCIEAYQECMREDKE